MIGAKLEMRNVKENINIEDAIEKIQEVKLEDVINVSNYKENI